MVLKSVFLKQHILISDPESPVELVVDTEKHDRDLVSFRGQGIPEDPLPVMQDKADDPGALFVMAFTTACPILSVISRRSSFLGVKTLLTMEFMWYM